MVVECMEGPLTLLVKQVMDLRTESVALAVMFLPRARRWNHCLKQQHQQEEKSFEFVPSAKQVFELDKGMLASFSCPLKLKHLFCDTLAAQCVQQQFGLSCDSMGSCEKGLWCPRFMQALLNRFCGADPDAIFSIFK